MSSTQATRLSLSNSRIRWSEKRESRLLDWIDSHPEEREILFSDQRLALARHRRNYKNVSTKLECYARAAKATFSVDEDKSIRNDLAKDSTYYANSVGTHIAIWKTGYQTCIKELGKETTNLPLGDIHRGSKAYKDIKQQLQYFPHWKRLHIYWQTLPHINFFLSVLPKDPKEKESDDSSEDSKSDSTNWNTKKRKRRPRGTAPKGELDKTAEAYHSGDDEDGSSASSPSLFKILKKEHHAEAIFDFSAMDADSDVEIIAVSKQMPGYRKRKDQGALGNAKVKQEAPTASREPNERQRAVQPQSRKKISASMDLSDGLTASQRHEERLAVLAVKLKELENASLEKKTAAEVRRMEIEADERRQAAEYNNQRAKEKHEMLMNMMSVTMRNMTQVVREEGKD